LPRFPPGRPIGPTKLSEYIWKKLKYFPGSLSKIPFYKSTSSNYLLENTEISMKNWYFPSTFQEFFPKYNFMKSFIIKRYFLNDCFSNISSISWYFFNTILKPKKAQVCLDSSINRTPTVYQRENMKINWQFSFACNLICQTTKK
jgi:hypothetical protein